MDGTHATVRSSLLSIAMIGSVILALMPMDLHVEVYTRPAGVYFRVAQPKHDSRPRNLEHAVDLFGSYRVFAHSRPNLKMSLY